MSYIQLFKFPSPHTYGRIGLDRRDVCILTTSPLVTLGAAACPFCCSQEILIVNTLNDPGSELAMPGKGSEENNQCWYALHIQSKFEKQVATSLRSKGYEEFLPLYRSRRQWSDRAKDLDLPLFPGYLFCRFDVRERLLPILTTPGVISIVGAGRVPVPVPDKEIEALQAVVRSGVPAQPWPWLSVGTKVSIEKGPLIGLEGIAVKINRSYRIVVSVQLLQRSVAVEIESSWAKPVIEMKRTSSMHDSKCFTC